MFHLSTGLTKQRSPLIMVSAMGIGKLQHNQTSRINCDLGMHALTPAGLASAALHIFITAVLCKATYRLWYMWYHGSRSADKPRESGF